MVMKYIPHRVQRWPRLGNRARASMPTNAGTTDIIDMYTVAYQQQVNTVDHQYILAA